MLCLGSREHTYGLFDLARTSHLQRKRCTSQPWLRQKVGASLRGFLTTALVINESERPFDDSHLKEKPTKSPVLLQAGLSKSFFHWKVFFV